MRTTTRTLPQRLGTYAIERRANALDFVADHPRLVFGGLAVACCVSAIVIEGPAGGALMFAALGLGWLALHWSERGNRAAREARHRAEQEVWARVVLAVLAVSGLMALVALVTPS